MHTRDWLSQLPPPDRSARPRVLARLEALQRDRVRNRTPLLLGAGVTAAAFACLVVLQALDTPRPTQATPAAAAVDTGWDRCRGADGAPCPREPEATKATAQVAAD